MSNLAADINVSFTAPERLKTPYLLGCPFCKRAPTIDRRNGVVRIECNSGCGAAAYVEASTEATAVARWNRRPA
jgi:hypothetical protein